MPYAPGVQDISGQLRAQGIAQAGQAWSQAIGNIGQSLNDAYNGYRQNKAMTDQAIAEFAATTRANPDILRYLSGASNEDDPNAPKLSPEVLKSFAKVQSGDFSLKDASMLNTFGKTYVNEKAKEVQAKHIALQNQLLGGQVAMQQADIDWMKNRAAAPTPTQPQPPIGIARFASPTVDGQAPIGTGLRAEAGFNFNAPWSPANPAGVVDPAQVEAEVKSSLPPSKQNTPDVAKKVQDIVDRRVKERERLMQAKEVMPSAQPRPIEGGKYLQTFDTRTNAPIGDPVPNPQHPEIAAELAGAQAESKAAVERATAFNSQIADNAQNAASDLYRIRKIRQLYEEGAQSGFGQSWLNSAQSALIRLGIGDADKITSNQVLQARLGEDALQKGRSAYKGQGAISEAERRRIDDISTTVAKNPSANLELVRMTEMAYNKSIAAEELRARLEASGKMNEKQIAAEIRAWVIKNPLENFASPSAPAASKTATSSAGGVPTVSSQAEYDALPAGSAYIDSTGKRAVKRGK